MRREQHLSHLIFGKADACALLLPLLLLFFLYPHHPPGHSGPLTSTQWHVEQLLLGAFNVLLWGAPKLWLILPSHDTWARFTASLDATPDGSAPFHLPRFLDKNYSFQELSLPEILRVGAVPVVQHPGDLLVTFPGWSMHGTVSAGPSIALASNTYWGPDAVQHVIQAAGEVTHDVTFTKQLPQQPPKPQARQQQQQQRQPTKPQPQQQQQQHGTGAGTRSSGIPLLRSSSTGGNTTDSRSGVTSVTQKFTRVTMLEQHWKILGAMGPPGVGAGVEEVGLVQRLGASQQQLEQLQGVVERWHYPTP
jgi:hypothetical protein